MLEHSKLMVLVLKQLQVVHNQKEIMSVIFDVLILPASSGPPFLHIFGAILYWLANQEGGRQAALEEAYAKYKVLSITARAEVVKLSRAESKKLILAFGKQPQGYPERQMVEWLEDLV